MERRDSGYRNSGHRNSGDRNSGHRNSGDRNSGHRNSGHSNSGNSNSGDFNSGDHNSGDFNSGDFNSGDFNSGFFCVATPIPCFFDRPVPNLSWEKAQAKIPHIDLPTECVWVPETKMTLQERQEFPTYKTIGGYLKTQKMPLTEAFPIAWAKLSNEEKAKWLELPNFDADKFLQITGVDVHAKEKHTIVIDGKTVTISAASYQALREHFVEEE